MKNYTVVPATLNGQDRFVVADLDGNVVDDMNGYGYLSKTTAYRALSYKVKNNML